jgi:hypothetical protein
VELEAPAISALPSGQAFVEAVVGRPRSGTIKPLRQATAASEWIVGNPEISLIERRYRKVEMQDWYADRRNPFSCSGYCRFRNPCRVRTGVPNQWLDYKSGGNALTVVLPEPFLECLLVGELDAVFVFVLERFCVSGE